MVNKVTVTSVHTTMRIIVTQERHLVGAATNIIIYLLIVGTPISRLIAARQNENQLYMRIFFFKLDDCFGGECVEAECTANAEIMMELLLIQKRYLQQPLFSINVDLISYKLI